MEKMERKEIRFEMVPCEICENKISRSKLIIKIEKTANDAIESEEIK